MMRIASEAVVIRYNRFERDIPIGMHKQTGAIPITAIVVKGAVANSNGTGCRGQKVL